MVKRQTVFLCADCPAGFSYLSSNRGCYKVVTRKMVWSDAGLACRAIHKDAHLLVINDSRQWPRCWHPTTVSLLCSDARHFCKTNNAIEALLCLVCFSSFTPNFIQSSRSSFPLIRTSVFVSVIRNPNPLLIPWSRSTNCCKSLLSSANRLTLSPKRKSGMVISAVWTPASLPISASAITTTNMDVE